MILTLVTDDLWLNVFSWILSKLVYINLNIQNILIQIGQFLDIPNECIIKWNIIIIIIIKSENLLKKKCVKLHDLLVKLEKYAR